MNEATGTPSSFLTVIEECWDAAMGTAPGSRLRTLARRISANSLILEVEAGNAKASISVRETSRSLEISVRRFKDERVLFRSDGVTPQQAQRALLTLVTELTIAPC